MRAPYPSIWPDAADWHLATWGCAPQDEDMKQVLHHDPFVRGAMALCAVLTMLCAPQVVPGAFASAGCDAPEPVCAWMDRIVGIKTPNMIASGIVLEDDAAGDHIRGLYADDPVHPGAYRLWSVASCRRKRTWHHLRRTEHGENCAQGHRAPDERIMMQDLFHVFILRRTPPRRKMPIRRVRPYAGIWGSHPSGRSAYVPASMSVPP